jgi:hypothetical protein
MSIDRHYVPVDPDSTPLMVHAHANPSHPSDTRTVCGASGEWVKSIILLPVSAVFCATCYTADDHAQSFLDNSEATS